MNTRKLLASAILVSGGFFAFSASADVITEWDWTTDGGFVIGGSTCNNGGEAACTLQYDNTSGVTTSDVSGTASVMTWGTGTTQDGGNSEQSGLQGVFGASGSGGHNAQLLGSDSVSIPQFEQIVTDGGWTNTGAAVHYNNVILTEDGFMQTSSVNTTFQLLTPGNGPVLDANIDIAFNETSNTAPCPGPNPHGTVCDDIFSVTPLPGPTFFTIDGKIYKLSFRYAAGEGAMIVGDNIFTSEIGPGTAIMFTQGRIDFVPVPGVLGLMGMGLLLMGWQVRARKSA